jgi:hypothetical protein
VFDTRGKRDAHQRRVHQLHFTTQGLLQQQLTRHTNGRIQCIYGRIYSMAQGLKRHQKNCSAAKEALDLRMIEEEGIYHRSKIINNSDGS